MRRLVQLIPSHHFHDAAGSEVLTIERLMAEAGWRVETYADNIDPELQGRTRPSTELEGADLSDAVIVYHYCAASEMTLRFVEMEGIKVVLYHNITPAEFFEPYDESIATACREGRRQFGLMIDAVDLAIGHSEYSRLELVKGGFDVTRTIPFLFDPARLKIEPDAAMLQRLAGDPVVLFVGRFAPNKATDDFVRTAAAYARLEGAPPARFVIVGKRQTIPAYSREVEALIAEAGLPEERLLITDEVSEEELAAAYRSASLFLSLSRHEGFMVPLLEAMHHGVPIMALQRAAVPETLGEAGVLFDTTDPEKVAGMVAQALSDAELRAELVERGRRRLQRYDLGHWGFVLSVLLESL